MMKNKLITIGIPCYNAQDTILRALKSAVSQDWDHKEILVVDDASSDQSIDVVQKFLKDHPDVRLIKHQGNLGPAAARQTVLENAKGSFIAFFDDDDESLPERLATQYKHICSYEEKTGETLIACYASGKRLYANGYEINMTAIGAKPEVPHGAPVADKLLFFSGDSSFFYGSGTPTCSLMARKSTFEAVGGFDPNFRRVEDVDFAIRVALAGGHFIGCQDLLFIQYSTQAIDKTPEKNRDAEIQLAEKHKAYLKSVGRYTYAKKWPLLRYHHFKGQYFQMLFILLELFIRHPLKTTSHFMSTAPKRFWHERRMKKRLSTCA